MLPDRGVLAYREAAGPSSHAECESRINHTLSRFLHDAGYGQPKQVWVALERLLCCQEPACPTETRLTF